MFPRATDFSFTAFPRKAADKVVMSVAIIADLVQQGPAYDLSSLDPKYRGLVTFVRQECEQYVANWGRGEIAPIDAFQKAPLPTPVSAITSRASPKRALPGDDDTQQPVPKRSNSGAGLQAPSRKAAGPYSSPLTERNKKSAADKHSRSASKSGFHAAKDKLQLASTKVGVDVDNNHVPAADVNDTIVGADHVDDNHCFAGDNDKQVAASVDVDKDITDNTDPALVDPNYPKPDDTQGLIRWGLRREVLLGPVSHTDVTRLFVRAALIALGGHKQPLHAGTEYYIEDGSASHHICLMQAELIDMIPGREMYTSTIHAVVSSYCTGSFYTCQGRASELKTQYLPAEGISSIFGKLSAPPENLSAVIDVGHNGAFPLTKLLTQMTQRYVVSVIQLEDRSHFCTFRADRDFRVVTVYDSIKPDVDQAALFTANMIKLMEFLCSRASNDAWALDTEPWSVQFAEGVYQQQNGYDCGVHAAQNAIDLIIFGDITAHHDGGKLRTAFVARLINLYQTRINPWPRGHVEPELIARHERSAVVAPSRSWVRHVSR